MREQLFHNQKKTFEEDLLSREEQYSRIFSLTNMLIKWFLGWMILTIIILISVYLFLPQWSPFLTAGYANCLFGGLLVFTSVLGGNYRNHYAAIAGLHKEVTADIHYARNRMFSNWIGPMIGLLIGLIFLIISDA